MSRVKPEAGRGGGSGAVAQEEQEGSQQGGANDEGAGLEDREGAAVAPEVVVFEQNPGVCTGVAEREQVDKGKEGAGTARPRVETGIAGRGMGRPLGESRLAAPLKR
ncbi:MAG: hypothetical protein C0504_10815 [Candidatus Solibacter sp.]|nr:hypothetical protein [Candidatus Solibacter sp.]